MGECSSYSPHRDDPHHAALQHPRRWAHVCFSGLYTFTDGRIRLYLYPKDSVLGLEVEAAQVTWVEVGAAPSCYFVSDISYKPTSHPSLLITLKGTLDGAIPFLLSFPFARPPPAILFHQHRHFSAEQPQGCISLLGR